MNGLIYDFKVVGERIRQKRKMLGLSQEQLAEIIGRSKKYCADIERGYCGMSIDMLLRLCGALKFSPSTLLLGDAIPDMGDSNITAQIMAGLAECSEEQKQNILQTIKLFIKR